MKDMSNKAFAIYAGFVAVFCLGLGYLMVTEKAAFVADCLEAGYRQTYCEMVYEQGPKPPMRVPRP